MSSQGAITFLKSFFSVNLTTFVILNFCFLQILYPELFSRHSALKIEHVKSLNIVNLLCPIFTTFVGFLVRTFIFHLTFLLANEIWY